MAAACLGAQVSFVARLGTDTLAGVPTVLVTLGADGALLASTDGVRHLPGFPMEHVADRTSAGDCFTGVLAVALAEGHSVDDASRDAAIPAHPR